MTWTRLDYLYSRCLHGDASEPEKEEFLKLIRIPENEIHARQLLHDAFGAHKEMEDVSPLTAASILEAIFQSDDKNNRRGTYFAKFRRLPSIAKVWSAVAVLLILFGAGAYFFFHPKMPANLAAVPPAKYDAMPGGNKATLTLAGGQKIILDSAANGQLARQGNTKIVKLDGGGLAYSSSKGNKEVFYNTLSIPAGGQYKLILPDGTAVWLNAASSITYPTVFTGNERRVTLSGEAYFEVVHDARTPFIVHTERQNITDIGTSFNVNTYPEEEDVATTLIRGAVKISGINYSDFEAKILKPGQQSRLLRDGKMDVVDRADTAAAIAWKEGLFDFDNTNLTLVLRQLGRWYDVKIKYEGRVPDREFHGKLPMDLKLSQVLKIFKEVGLEFRLEDGTIVIRS
jgi:transmembrane sensor